MIKAITRRKAWWSKGEGTPSNLTGMGACWPAMVDT